MEMRNAGSTAALPLALLLGLGIFVSAGSPAAAAGQPTPFDASAAPHPDSLARLVASRYGAFAFDSVEKLEYTFKVRFAGKEMERAWVWHPRADSVEYHGKDSLGVPVAAAYSRRNRYSMGSPGIAPIDKMFINDQYWLLFPMHLVWDKGVSLRAAPLARTAPAKKSGKAGPGQAGGAGEVWQLTAVYPSEGGYTPGDAYDLFLDSTGTIKRWIYRRGNAAEPTREAMWSRPVAMGPLHLSLEHPSPGNDGFKLWFENVRVASREVRSAQKDGEEPPSGR